MLVIRMTGWVWRDEFEMTGCGHGGRPDSLPEKEEEDQDIEPDNE